MYDMVIWICKIRYAHIMFLVVVSEDRRVFACNEATVQYHE